MENTLILNGKKVPINNAKNLLELIRANNIELPTFCYHSELSVYGACRLCIVEIEGRGVVTSCTTKPEPGMVVYTNTEKLRKMRKINLELLLANHDYNCTTCEKNGDCRLQNISKKLGIYNVRFGQRERNLEKDTTGISIQRDPNKCVLCGDCVRMCSEIQSIGAIYFTFRGSNAIVQPEYGRNLSDTNCINCGQCIRVCPTGALTFKRNIDEVFEILDNKEYVKVVQFAPAVRVAIGEMFGYKPGEITTGKIVAALKYLGFDYVFDTSFGADLTVVEEGTEFIQRKKKNENLPLFTSCCPAWVKYAEENYPEMLNHLSTCKSPQQMFGSAAKELLSEKLNVPKDKIKIVSVMPCTAKKYEAKREEFAKDGVKEVDVVITTKELGEVIKCVGIDFTAVEEESLDLPLGFKTGAGVIFGVTGGVSEAVLRYAYEALTNKTLKNVEFEQVRGLNGVREAVLEIDGNTINMAIVHGIANAKNLIEKIKKNEVKYDIIEVMACPGGCINGGGQPVAEEYDYLVKRANGLYLDDKRLQLHKSQDNPYIKDFYAFLECGPGEHKAHDLLHTHYFDKKKKVLVEE